MIRLHEMCYTGGGIGSFYQRKHYTYDHTTSDSNGEYFFNTEVDESDKDCNVFELDIQYVFNQFLHHKTIMMTRGETPVTRITELYLHCRLYIAIKIQFSILP